MLWVAPALRGAGLGRQLTLKVESETVRRGCHSIYLWTQDFEAPGFYEKMGYEAYCTLEDFYPGHRRIGFKKRMKTSGN